MSQWSRTKIWGNEILYPVELNTEFNQGMNAYNTHRTSEIIDHPDKSITPAKLDANASKNTIILTPAGAILPASATPALVQINGTSHSYYVLDYDPSANEQCYYHFTMPVNWDGKKITAYIKYIANATSGAVVWQIALKGISEGENRDQAVALGLNFPADTVRGTANYLNIVSGTLVMTPVTAGEWVILRMRRNASDAADTLAVDARLLEVVLEWNI
jgi:hypothetical protein